MTKGLSLLLLLLCVVLTETTFATGQSRVQFHQGSLTGAKELAGKTGKLYFVDFVANYCYQCSLMDETTFMDERLANYVDGSYIPVKVNVEDFDGYAWKKKYNIKMLPTILVFNSKGKLLARYEEAMSAVKMLKVLKKYDKPENRVKHNGNELPPRPPATRPPGNNNNNSNEGEIAPPGRPSSAETAGSSSGEGLFEFTVKRKPSKGFGVQIGVYAQYGNVLKEVEKLDKKFDAPILVHITNLRGRVVYRIVVGSFARKNEAIEYRKKMQNKGINGILKDLSTMK